MRHAAVIPFVLLTACSDQTLPGQPSTPEPAVAQSLSLEAEAGSGQGEVMQRPKASGGVTIHLAPGERRQWTFSVAASQAEYAIAVTYSNDNIGETETIRVSLDDVAVGAFEARDTGDDGEGWSVFETDLVGTSTLARGNHTLVISSSGGDGCIEIDKVTLTAR
jgi:hypothetical protein